MAFWKTQIDGQDRWVIGPVGQGPERLLRSDVRLSDLVRLSGLIPDDMTLHEAAESLVVGDITAGGQLLPPIDAQEVWASGVTYLNSRRARMAESDSPDHYDRVYVADRPELFFKSTARRVRGPGQAVCIRRDSDWNVPEPELAALLRPDGALVALTICNDMSSRSIEGENPLYLPQAKVYEGGCALGPCLVTPEEAGPVHELTVHLEVTRGESAVFDENVSISAMRRPIRELAAYLTDYLDFPEGVFLSTGTGIVPPDGFTLKSGDVVRVKIEGIGQLENWVDVLKPRSGRGT